MDIKQLENYNDAVSYILEIPRFSAKNSPEDTKAFLKLIGEPDTKTVIHVAGTNGKGSTCAFLNSVHMQMGKKTGMFTSPHLVDIRERIRVDGEMISEEQFLKITNYILEQIVKFNKEDGVYHPSFFEFVFFIAVVYFAQENVDVAIYETGLGGRLDATNSLSKKDICIITEIGFDHMEYLGDTLEAIAGEKAGIIRPETLVVYWSERDICSQVIEDKAGKMGSQTYSVGKNTCGIINIEDKGIDFYYKNSYDININYTVCTYAHYQVWNAAMALKTLEVLYGTEFLENVAVAQGIAGMKWPGRMERIEDNVFIDGGHNVDGVEAFLASVSKDECKGKRYLVFSAVSDKQVETISRMIIESDLFEQISLCEMQGSRARSLDNLYGVFKEQLNNVNKNVTLKTYDDAMKAYDGEKVQLKAEDRLYVCGSLYLVGSVLEYIEAKKK